MQRKAHAVGRRRADQRRAAHLHGADRVRGVRERRQPQRGETMRQQGLVDHADRPAVRLDPDGAGMSAVDLHASLITRFAGGDKAACPCGHAGPISARSGGAPWRRSTTRPNTTTARGCRSIRRSSRAGRAEAEHYRAKAMEERRAELGLNYGSTPRADHRPVLAGAGRQGAAGAVHPRRLLALARPVAVQPHGARAQRARRRRWRSPATISARR